MARREGEITPRILKREYPWFCELPVVFPGLGEGYAAMTNWCRSQFGERGFGVTSRQESQERGMPIEYVQFRFRSEEDADTFRAEFGGAISREGSRRQ